jgi:hypothetical protein
MMMWWTTGCYWLCHLAEGSGQGARLVSAETALGAQREWAVIWAEVCV